MAQENLGGGVFKPNELQIREEHAPVSAKSSSSRPWQGACAAPVLGKSSSLRPSSDDSASSSSRPSSGASAASQGSNGARKLYGWMRLCCRRAHRRGCRRVTRRARRRVPWRLRKATTAHVSWMAGLIPAKLAHLFPYMTLRVNWTWVVSFVRAWVVSFVRAFGRGLFPPEFRPPCICSLV